MKPRGRHVIEPVGERTGSSKCTADRGLEFIARLNREGWIEALDVSVKSVLWNSQQTGAPVVPSSSFGASSLITKPLAFPSVPGQGNAPHGASPFCRADIGGEVIARVDRCLAGNVDLDPDRFGPHRSRCRRTFHWHWQESKSRDISPPVVGATILTLMSTVVLIATFHGRLTVVGALICSPL